MDRGSIIEKTGTAGRGSAGASAGSRSYGSRIVGAAHAAAAVHLARRAMQSAASPLTRGVDLDERLALLEIEVGEGAAEFAE